MSAPQPGTVKPSVPAPDTYDGKPATLRSWLFSLELYFAACKLDKDGDDRNYCCALTASLLRGSALAWYRTSCVRTPGSVPKTYADLKKVLEDKFGVVQEDRNARDKLRTLTQRSSVHQYMEVFQATALGIEHASDAELLHAFIYGLKDRVRAEVRLRNPATLTEAARLALDFDELMRPVRYEKSDRSNWRGNVAPQRSQGQTGPSAHASSSGVQPMELGAV